MHLLSATIDSAYVREWADLLVRWLHVVAGIAWIGASFYFILLDNHLDAPRRAEDAEAGVGGEAWEVHGGGFYHVQKYRVAPRTLPDHLQWFKWEAYTTWLSGFALLCIVYFSNARAYLIDRSVADLTVPEAIGISIGFIVAAWIVYDVLCRVLGRFPRTLALALFGFIALSAYVSGPDPAHGIKGKLRSVHNNYLTLPVLLAMLSNHFPFVYGHDHAWLILCAFVALGAYVRHFFNLRHAGRTKWSMPVVAALAVLGLAIWLQPPGEPAAPATTSTSLAAGKHLFETVGCMSCHTLRDAGATGVIGPSLDAAKPSRSLVVNRVTNGQGAMPPFGNQLSPRQIGEIADYVSTVAGT